MAVYMAGYKRSHATPEVVDRQHSGNENGKFAHANLLLESALFASGLSQSSMGAAMVCITTNTNTTTNRSAPGNHSTETIDWDKQTQGWILGVRFLLYYLCQLPSGHLLSWMSSTAMGTVGFLSMGAFDVLTVPSAERSLAALFVVRAAQGIGNGSTPGFGMMRCPRERHSTPNSITPLRCGLSLVLSAVWFLLVTDDPAVSRWMGQEEKNYIMACKQHEIDPGKVPWSAMLRSGPIYAVVLAQLSEEWLLFLSVTVGPAFFTDVMQLTAGQRGILTTVRIRRLAQGVGKHRAQHTALGNADTNLVPALCCLLMALLSPEDRVATVAAFAVGVVTYTCCTSGLMANMSDLAPQQTGAVLALCQALSVWVSFFVPVFVDYLTVHKTKEEWNTVFYITAALQLLGFVGFYTLSSGEIQPWAQAEESRPLRPLEPASRQHTSY
ncbi:sialin-like [Babylonia areolata]|uniref:sialin-like n=1 Tax=Babylonia areolata TaxID=304850 RepID=UPI003FCFAA5A